MVQCLIGLYPCVMVHLIVCFVAVGDDELFASLQFLLGKEVSVNNVVL